MNRPCFRPAFTERQTALTTNALMYDTVAGDGVSRREPAGHFPDARENCVCV